MTATAMATKTAKKATLDWQTNNFVASASRFFVHYFFVVAA